MRNCRLDLGKKLKDELGLSDSEIDTLNGALKKTMQEAAISGTPANTALQEFAEALKYSRDAYQALRIKDVEAYTKMTATIANNPGVDQARLIETFLQHDPSLKYKSDILPLVELIDVTRNKGINVAQKWIRKVEGGYKLLKNGTHDRDLIALRRGELDLKDVSEPVRMLYQGIKDLGDYLYAEKTRAGHMVKYRSDRIAKLEHPNDFSKLPPEDFVKLAKETWDFDAMGVAPDKEDEVISHFLKNRKSKSSQKDMPTDLLEKLAMGKTSLEHGRYVQFKNADAEFKYRQTVTDKEPLVNALLRELDYDSRKIASSKIFGPNYRLGFRKLKENTLNSMPLTASAAEKKAMERKLNGIERSLEAQMQPAIPGDSGIARTGNFIRSVVRNSLMTTSLLTSVPDIATAAGVVSTATGDNYFMTLGSMFKDLSMNISRNKRRDFAEHLGLFVDDVLSTLVDHSSKGDKFTKGLTSWSNFYMNATGLPDYGNMLHVVTAKHLTRNLADGSDKAFGDLFKGQRDLLSKFGIGEKEWSVMSKSVYEFDGKNVITPEGIRTLKGAGIPQQRLDDIADSYAASLRSLGYMGSPTGSPMWMKNMTSALDPNTASGQAARTVSMFLSYPTSILRSVRYANEGGIANMASTSVSMISLGYLGWIAGDMIKGKEIEDITTGWGKGKKKDTKRAMNLFFQIASRSGLAGPFADLLSVPGKSAGRDITNVVLGPVFGGALPDTIDAARKTIDRTWQNSPAKMQPAVDYMIKYTPLIPFVGPAIKSIIGGAIYDVLNYKAKKPNKVYKYAKKTYNNLVE